jgi:anti-sigma regulatory factor (Ser/Thr protein kinase)
MARAWVRESLEDWDGDPAVDHAELLVSEVATNALLHGGTDRPVVDVTHSAELVRVSVRDRTRDRPARTFKDDPMTPGGYGVVLLDEISSRWGVAQRVGGKTVWFELTSTAGHRRT